MEVKLKVLVGKSSGSEIPVPLKRFLIGRGDDCHMRPKSEAISRNHCAILVNEETDELIIRDLNSRNGTYVNGNRISTDTALDTGDRIQIGRLEFEVNVNGRKRAPEPVKAAGGVTDSSGSLEFDVTEWLQEADAAAKAQKRSDPDTRQFRLDETDRIALEAAKQTLESVEVPEEAAPAKKSARPEKKAPGKLPDSAKAPAAANSRDAAADMLKKFFNNR